MQNKQDPQFGFVQMTLPWAVTAGALILYLVTLVPWLTQANLGLVAKVAGLDWTPPLTAPLFFLITLPVRLVPAGWQPVILNVLSALCAAGALGLLVRSVSLLPHDRTHAQRLKERSEFSVLTIRLAWVPALLAALVCGFQLTFWEHAIAATGEALNLLLFAYVIRCLLEFRIDQDESWLKRFAFVYGLGVANNWAMIGFFPLFLVAVIWIRGIELFRFKTFISVAACGVIGLLLYFFLPILWSMSDASTIGFWEALRAEMVNQKNYLFGGGLRSRAVILSLTSILPVLIMGIRWPSSFGDTSAAGAILTNFMFRVIHFVFFGACLWIFFDQKFSPRSLGLGVPFLTFYYLSALAVGYFSGYLLLVFGEMKTRPSRRRSSENPALNRAVVGLVMIVCIGVPVGLVAKNFQSIWNFRKPMLREFAESAIQSLPSDGAIVLSDDPYGFDLLVLRAHLKEAGIADRHVLIHSRSLSVPEYHRRLSNRYPTRFPNALENEPIGEAVEDTTLLALMSDLARSNRIFYLHPSFGFYFERFYSRPHGLVHELALYGSNQFFPPPLSSDEIDVNERLWAGLAASLTELKDLSRSEVADARYLGRYYSRALNDWAVELQRHDRIQEAEKWLRLAVDLNTNNRPASVNLDFNRILRSPGTAVPPAPKTRDERFGIYRDWETLLGLNGSFDHPDYLLQLGEILSQQSLYRQAAIDLDRAVRLDPANLLARFALATNYLQGVLPDKALAVANDIRSSGLFDVDADTEVGLLRLEAAAQFSKTNYAVSEKILLDGAQKYPGRPEVLDALVMFYGQTKRFDDALKTIDRILAISNDNSQALINQATIYFNTRAYDKALESLNRVLRRDARNLSALLYTVFILIETKDYADALAEVEKILAIEENKPEALLYKGVVLIETRQFEAAIKPLDRVLELQPNNFNALQNRAIANLQSGNLDEAEDDYLKLLGLQPRYFVAYYGLGEIAYKRKETAEAIKYYEFYLKYSAQFDDSPELLAERELIQSRLAELRGVGG